MYIAQNEFIVSGTLGLLFLASVSAFNFEAFKKAASAASNAVAEVKAKQAAAAAKMAENMKEAAANIAAVAATAKNQLAEETAMKQGNQLAIERRSKEY